MFLKFLLKLLVEIISNYSHVISEKILENYPYIKHFKNLKKVTSKMTNL
jgi:hypothetical protein